MTYIAMKIIIKCSRIFNIFFKKNEIAVNDLNYWLSLESQMSAFHLAHMHGCPGYDQRVIDAAVNVKVHTLDIAPLRSDITTAEALRYGTCSQGISQFYLHTHTFFHNRNEPCLPLPSQLQLVLIYRPRRD